jgi:hypothetical protein
MNKRIPPKASAYTEFSRERALRLATLRRGPLDEFTWAALTGLGASLPSTAHSAAEIYAATTFSLSLPQSIDFGVTLIFFTLLMVAIFSRRNRGMTSVQYLEHHFGPDPEEPPRKPWFGWFR